MTQPLLFGGPQFNGPDYRAEHDYARLSGQLRRVHDLMIDGVWRTLREIEEATGDPQSSISAQLRHMRKLRFGSHYLGKRPRGDRGRGLYEYTLTEPLNGCLLVGPDAE